jgi:hypothetical protein
MSETTYHAYPRFLARRRRRPRRRPLPPRTLPITPTGPSTGTNVIAFHAGLVTVGVR